MTKTDPAEQFAGIPESDWTDPMRLAIKQRWTKLPMDAKVDELRARLAAVTVAPIDEDALRADFPDVEKFEAELKRRKRNAAVNAWRERNQIQAALDARQAKFAALRSKRGKTAGPAKSETGDAAAPAPDPAPMAAAS